GIFRQASDLERALTLLEQLAARQKKVGVPGTRVYNPGWHMSRDLRNMILVSQAITRSALLRKESRGAHSRLDHPGLDPELGKVNLCARLEDGCLEVTPSPLPAMPPELQVLFEEKKA